MKKFVLIALTLGLIVACNNQEKEDVTVVTSEEFVTVAQDMVDQTISLDATVLHICKHGGKKMFVGDQKIKVVASEKLASFDAALEGSTVTIKGIVREEALPVLTEDEQKKDRVKAEIEVEDKEEVQEDKKVETADAEAEPCDMEKVKPLYIIEVIEVTEKEQ